MAKLVFRTGKRGRPMELDTNKVLSAFYEHIPSAQKSLSKFRKESSGINTPELLGTTTSLPEWLESSLDALEMFDPAKITIDMAKSIKEDLQIIKRLASKRASVSSTALEKTITKQYLESLDTAIDISTSKFSKERYQQIKKMLSESTPAQRMKFYKSKQYQDVGSFRNQRYKRIKQWAEANVGYSLTYKESYAYLIERRALDGMDTAEEIKAVAYDGEDLKVGFAEMLDF